MLKAVDYVFRCIVTAVSFLITTSSSTEAACTSPAGEAGAITWNGTVAVIWCYSDGHGSVQIGRLRRSRHMHGPICYRADAHLGKVMDRSKTTISHLYFDRILFGV